MTTTQRHQQPDCSNSCHLFELKAFSAAVMFGSVLFTSTLGHAGQSATLTPVGLRTTQGTASEPGVTALAVEDQRADSDDWLSYVEFYPGRKRLVSIIDFEAPIDFIGQQIQSLTVKANYRGPARSEQRWQWHVRNFRTKRWSRLGDNSGVHEWQWTRLAYEAGGDAADYINALGKTHLRYSSPTAIDNSNLDSVSIEVELPDPAPVETPAAPETQVWSPAPGTSWQWQLSGTIDTSFPVEMYDIDLFDVPQSTIDELQARNVAVICYFSAGSFEDWRTDAAAFPDSVKGKSNGWAGERWLDISALEVLAPIMSARLDLAVYKGCDGVEPDNVDGYTNESGFPLSAQDQLDFNIWLADAAHARGLSIGLKNDLEQVAQLEPWFDWALNEQCVQYEECDMLTPFVEAGKAVFGVDYTGDAATVCSVTNALNFDWLLKPKELGALRESCR